MSRFKPQPPRYDRRRLEQLVMEQRLRALLQTRTKNGRGSGK